MQMPLVIHWDKTDGILLDLLVQTANHWEAISRLRFGIRSQSLALVLQNGQNLIFLCPFNYIGEG